MKDDTAQSIENWVKYLPASRMIYPEEVRHRVKYLIWRFYTPFHPFFRDLGLALGIVKHEGRQDFLIGKVAPGQTMREFVEHCLESKDMAIILLLGAMKARW